MNTTDKTFYVGNLRDDAVHGKNHGWVVGTFLQDLPRQTDHMEVKYWEYPKGVPGHDTKTSVDVTEWVYILKGKSRALLGDQEIIVQAGDYVLIHPGTISNVLLEVLEDIQGVTVKSPSMPSAKQVI
jgi:quercetin dioxygenase-like cupin family protein